MSYPHVAAPILRRVALLLALLAVATLVALLWRDPLFRAIAGAAATSAPSLALLVRLWAEVGLLALVAVTAGVAVAVVWRRRERLVLLLSAGAGTVVAYGSSEAIKLLAAEDRPCHVVPIRTVSACPAVGDWSWPSNHATIAAALATCCVLVLPDLCKVVAPLALLVGSARVAAGVHYVHDVTSGLILGVAVTVVVSLLLQSQRQRSQPAREATEVGPRAELSPTSSSQGDGAVLVDPPARVVRDLPDDAVRVSHVGVEGAAELRGLRRLEDRAAGGDHGVHR
jgi:membrane-associated phospholipid phosphatase